MSKAFCPRQSTHTFCDSSSFCDTKVCYDDNQDAIVDAKPSGRNRQDVLRKDDGEELLRWNYDSKLCPHYAGPQWRDTRTQMRSFPSPEETYLTWI